MKIKQITSKPFTWEYPPNSFKCLIKHVNEALTKQMRRGMRFSYVIKSIGSKHRLLCEEIGKFDQILEKMLDPLNGIVLLQSGGPRAYVDISLKYVPTCPETGDKVIFYTVFQKIY